MHGGIRELRPRQQRVRRSFRRRATLRDGSASSRDKTLIHATTRVKTCFGVTPDHPSPSRILTTWNGKTWLGAIRNNRPYNEVKRGVEASLVTSMAAWRRTQARSSPTMKCSTANTNSRPGWTVDQRLAGAVAGRRQRQIPGPATGHRDETEY